MTERTLALVRRISAALASRLTLPVAILSVVFMSSAPPITAQASPQHAGVYERTYHQSKSAVEKALQELQPALSGRLPALEGFASAADHPLNRYQRAYYQSSVQVSPTPSGGSIVRVTTKVTAWYSDAIPSHSGYQLLTSNGRLESDLLDQLSDLVASKPTSESTVETSRETPRETPTWPSNTRSSEKGSSNKATNAGNANPEPNISASAPEAPDTRHLFTSPSAERGLSPQQLADSKNSQKPLDQPSGLQAEAASLEEVLKNQAHPKNLVAIKKSGTPVVSTPSLTGKTLFMASARDEFEMLDYNADWVHVRISGLSRGWIWRTSLEMPEGISDVPLNGAKAAPVAADLFQVTREETAPFPGDWNPLRGKNVKIISVQKIQENEKDSGAQAKLEFAKSLLDKNYADLASKSKELSGIVLIFDSVDGGMIAATLGTVQQWKAGTLTDAALWHQCYFDPPETFVVSGTSGQ